MTNFRIKINLLLQKRDLQFIRISFVHAPQSNPAAPIHLLDNFWVVYSFPVSSCVIHTHKLSKNCRFCIPIRIYTHNNMIIEQSHREHTYAKDVFRAFISCFTLTVKTYINKSSCHDDYIYIYVCVYNKLIAPSPNMAVIM